MCIEGLIRNWGGMSPFFISSCSGMAANMLGVVSSRAMGRRLRLLAEKPADIQNLEEAAHRIAVSTTRTHRAYMSITLKGSLTPVVLETAPDTANRACQLRVTLFRTPASDLPSCLSEGRVIYDECNESEAFGINFASSHTPLVEPPNLFGELDVARCAEHDVAR